MVNRFIYVYMCKHVCIHTCIYIYLHRCTHIYPYILRYTHTNTSIIYIGKKNKLTCSSDMEDNSKSFGMGESFSNYASASEIQKLVGISIYIYM
jgi:hypothetical protein